MIPYVGDVSKRDAEVLRVLAKRASRILEFGCGASTQILAAYGRGSVASVETDYAWIKKTRRNLEVLEIKKEVEFYLYDEFEIYLSSQFDLIFIDGVNHLRLPFAFRTWPALAVGGAMCFHDTRRTTPHGIAVTSDVQNVSTILASHSAEITSVMVNQEDSNITVIRKREPLLLEDWVAVEGRTPQQMGLE